MGVKKTAIMKQQFPSFLSFLFFGTLFFVISACSSSNAVEEEIAKIPVNVELDRFDKKFYNASKEDFFQLKQEYPYLFPEQYPDSIWLKRQRDSLQVILQNEINVVFPTLDPFEEQLK